MALQQKDLEPADKVERKLPVVLVLVVILTHQVHLAKAVTEEVVKVVTVALAAEAGMVVLGLILTVLETMIKVVAVEVDMYTILLPLVIIHQVVC